MTETEALNYINSERTNNTSLTVPQKDDMQLATAVLGGTNISITEDEALELLNNIYYDATLSNKKNFGIAVFSLGYTVNPDRPYPKIRA